jgi:hypothetical protein
MLLTGPGFAAESWHNQVQDIRFRCRARRRTQPGERQLAGG